MAIYYRWIARGADLQAAQRGSLQLSASPRIAYFVFDISGHLPKLDGERVLVAITFTPNGETILADRSKWILFPSPAVKGEAQHPDQIIIKTNEPGTYGIGRALLNDLNKFIKEVRLANREELAKALGKAVPKSQVDLRMRDQKW